IIKNNTIIGNRANTRVGGISVSSLLSVISFAQIENNTIKDNRYGITITGVTAGGNIIGNTIENNNTENVPNTGGSGISISQTATAPKTSVTIKGNTIKGNLWGITIIGNGTNIDMTNGYNVFENNGNTGLDYALYNNSANNIKAQGNCWDPILTDERVENVIFHKPDNSTLGLVDHSNYACLLSTNEVKLDKLKLYPNPSNGTFVVDTKEKSTYQIYDINGRLVKQGELKIGQNNIQTNLKKGVYIMKTNQSSSKIIVK
ncbi:MAG: T9SS type A sorting domain-containing protein, partial [Bacilli bacterium]